MRRFPQRLWATRLIGLLAVMLSAGAVGAEIKLPAVIGDHMVIQRGQPVSVWGWAVPGETVTVSLAGKTASIQADKQGRWQMKLEPMDASSEALSMALSGSRSERRVVTDILVGEVWLCSGQSNMEWALSATLSPLPEIRRAEYPQIRLFHIPRRASPVPLDDVEATWAVCRPETVSSFSAVAYYFGREIHERLGLPVGLINSSWGGTRIEPWTPPAGFQAVPEVLTILDELPQAEDDYRRDIKSALPAIKDWVKTAEAKAAANEVVPVAPPIPAHPLMNPQKPTSLYNGMIYALIPFPIRGAIWYQGEANRNDGAIYTKKMEALIKGWRNVWGSKDFPFYFVQLAPYNYPYDREMTGGDIPDFERLPLIWEAQVEALKIANTGMAVTTDIANLNDIHPRNKMEVGRRLALWARAQVYGESGLVFSGPLYESMAVEGPRARLRFRHIGSGLISLDGRPLTWFEVAGEDRIFYKAQAEIEGDGVVVWSPRVEKPTAVRFGWNQLAEPNLGNQEGLPASPFRTDRW
jgi:sialate O-acetylesterase